MERAITKKKESGLKDETYGWKHQKLTVFENYLVKHFAVCLDVVAILLLNVMDVFSVGGGALLDNRVWASK